mgnify:CR=1 FL=1
MARILQHESRDVDDQAKALNDWQQSYEQLGCGRFRGSAWQLVMDQGVLLRESTNRPLAEHITPPKDHLVLALPVTVEPGSVFSGRPMERDSLMVLSDREQYDVISAGALDLIGLSVHSDTVAATLAPSKIEWLERAGHGQFRPLGCAEAVAHVGVCEVEPPEGVAELRVVGGNRAGFAHFLRPPAQMRQAVLERAGR